MIWLLKTKQNQRNIFNFLKLILFIGVLLVIYGQVKNVDPNSWKNFSLYHPFSLVISALLIFPNIWLAYLKWKLTLSVVAKGTSDQVSRQSFFAGIVTGMLTPNMIGNFIGRFYYFERSKRVGITLFTLLSNYAQFLASLTFGWVAVLIVGKLYVFDESKSTVIWLGIGVVSAYLFYFFIDNFLYRIRSKGYVKGFRERLRKHKFYRSKVLLLSLLRFGVFTTQFSLVLYAFGEEISVDSIMAIWQVYLITMIFPSLVLGKLGIKEAVSITVLGGMEMNTFAIIFSSLIIWFMNSLLPALMGLVICKRPLSEY